jgi:siderophore synthetase component
VDLPAGVERVSVDVPEELHLLSVFTDVFDCFFRHLAALLDGSGTLSAQAFWDEVAAVCEDYQRAHPGLADRFERNDLFAPEFPLSCLNRLQLRNNQEMVDLADPAGALALAGELANPLAARRLSRTG